MMNKTWLPLVMSFCIPLLLSACQQTPSRQGFYSSPLFAGDELEVLQTITIPAGLARIYLQHGKTMTYATTDQYAPFCYFLLRDPLPVEQQIKPGIWIVDSVWLEEVSFNSETQIKVATAGFFVVASSRSPVAYQSYIRLKSQQQAPMTLVCSGAFESPNSAQPIRLPELREVLGKYAEARVQVSVGSQ